MDHGPEILLLEMFAIFLAAKVVGELFERLQMPAVLGEILAGVVLGPYALGWIHPTVTINSMAEIGAIFVLFNAGLETSPGDLIRVGRTALLVALAGIVFPFVLGFGYMKLIGDVTTEAVFVGAAMVATSVGITARVLGDLNVLSSQLAKVILGAAVFDDILGMVILAVVAGLASAGGVNWLRMGVLLGEAVAFALFMILVAPRILRRMHTGVDRLSTRNAPLIVALAICLLFSWLALKIGMAAIIGAFFAGLMFADFAPRWDLLPKAHAIKRISGALLLLFHRRTAQCRTVHRQRAEDGDRDFHTGDPLQSRGLRPADGRQGVAFGAGSWRGHDAAGRSGADRRAGRTECADCHAGHVCHRRIHDRGHDDSGPVIPPVLCSVRNERMPRWHLERLRLRGNPGSAHL